MNKIKVVKDNLKIIKLKDIQTNYYKKDGPFSINELKIEALKSGDLQVDIVLEDGFKLNIDINIKPNVILNLTILTKGDKGKIQYKYNLDKNSECFVSKFQNVDSIKEMIIIKLNGENSSINYNFKTISDKKETYDYHIFHRAKNTKSLIRNNGVCIKDGTITYQVSSFVPKDIKGCTVKQNNRIINLTNNKCEINPNLYIDCKDVSASHSALIGKFSDDEMFYIQSRGIDYKNAIKLLINGFLNSNITNKVLLKEITKNINKYWR